MFGAVLYINNLALSTGVNPPINLGQIYYMAGFAILFGILNLYLSFKFSENPQELKKAYLKYGLIGAIAATIIFSLLPWIFHF